MDYLDKIQDVSDLEAFRHKWHKISERHRVWLKTTLKELYCRQRVWEQEESLSQDVRYAHGHRRAGFSLLVEILETLDKKNEKL